MEEAKSKAIYELDRNLRILNLRADNPPESVVDRTLLYFMSTEGKQKFEYLIMSAPASIKAVFPKILCDKELKGPWTKYAKVWRFVYDDSFYDATEDYTFFTF